MSEYDDKVEQLVLRHFVDDAATEVDRHMAECESLRVVDYISSGSQCDSGCESTRLEADLECDHHTSVFEYGTWGDMASLIQELEEI